MIDQYFGIKELQHVTLRAKTPMWFGRRYVEADEPVLYFENVSFASINEQSRSIFARGGWQNLPHVTWEDRSEVHFQLQEGVMSSISLGILLDANVIAPDKSKPILVPMREIFYSDYFDDMDIKLGRSPKDIVENPLPPVIFIKHEPLQPNQGKKVFIMQYDNDTIQRKIYGKRVSEIPGIPCDPFTGNTIEDSCPIILYNEDPRKQDWTAAEEKQYYADKTKDYVIDYYYEYDEDVLTYTLHKERFNGLFTLEGKFYSKDENEGKNYTNLIYMPKVRVMSDINLRLGERANPAVGTFDIVGMPETYNNEKKSVIMEITRLNSDLDEEK